MPDDSQSISAKPSGMTKHVGSGERKVNNGRRFPHKITADPQSNSPTARREDGNGAVNKEKGKTSASWNLSRKQKLSY